MVALDFQHERGFRTFRRFIDVHMSKGDSVVGVSLGGRGVVIAF